MRQAILISLAALTLGGCYKTNLHFADSSNDAMNEEIWHHRFVYGLVEAGPVKLQDICPNGVAKVHEKTSFMNGFVQQFVGWIYSPNTVQVHCMSGAAYDAELDNDGLVVAAEPIAKD